MVVRFSDCQHQDNPFEGMQFDDAERLLNSFRKLPYSERFVIELEHADGAQLLVGIGADVAPVQFTGAGGVAPLAIGEGDGFREDVEFLCGGTATPFARRNCLSAERFREVVRHFMRTGERDPRIVWELA